MNNFESEQFEKALQQLNFDNYEKEILLKILAGSGNQNQEDILNVSDRSIGLLRKLGWYKRVKLAIKVAGLKINLDTFQ